MFVVCAPDIWKWYNITSTRCFSAAVNKPRIALLVLKYLQRIVPARKNESNWKSGNKRKVLLEEFDKIQPNYAINGKYIRKDL